MPAYHCELAWLGGDSAERDVLVVVAGERITAVETAVAKRPEAAIRLPGLTVPGLANAHSHAFHRALRGRTHRKTGSFWTWREQMYELAASLDPDSYHRLARAVFAEMALAGISVVGEFHYLHQGPGGVPYADPNAMGAALLAAAADAGIRITLLDTCYLQGGIGVEPDDTQRRFADRDAPAWEARASALADSVSPGSPGVRIGAAIHSVRAVDPPAMAIVAAWAAARAAPLHAHVSEQPAENERCVAAYGRTPTELLSDSGALSGRFTAVHATHLVDADVGLLGASSCWCCFCPTTERDLADGIGPSRALRDAGARLTLGSDSHAVIDLLEEARAVELDERLARGVRGSHDAAALLRMATEHGHASLGYPDAGRISPGCYADLTTIGLDSVRTTGTRPDDAPAVAVFAATAADIRHVVIGGRVVVADGRHTSIDVVGALRQVLR
ncbi:MAG TPA: formimidoylglutamate deiminase [Acidimicrobiia bacterium]|nr:formimidoylglutamate deiminase [Acidimicrobiia bacterium]